MIPGFLHHLTKKASDGVVGHGLAASVPEKMRETFRNVACRFAEIRPKLKMAHDLQPAEVEKVEAAFRSGELDGWLNSEATEDFSSWPVVQAICHARETTLRAEKRSAALQELMELEAKENLMDLSEATTGAADGPGMDAGLISEQKQRATSLLDWLRAREDSQKLIAKLYRDVAESEQHKVEARWWQTFSFLHDHLDPQTATYLSTLATLRILRIEMQKNQKY